MQVVCLIQQKLSSQANDMKKIALKKEKSLEENTIYMYRALKMIV